jgi:Fe-S cluster assembly iron-binding protein IscA
MIHKAVRDAGIASDEWFVRVDVERAKTDGNHARLKFETAPRRGDVTFEIDQIPVLIHRSSLQALFGTRIRFGERDGKPGFIFEGPLFE